jgi:broad specificity phosphatase PhoE
MEIILARHGKPNLQQSVWITPRQLKDWIQRYNQADLLVEEVPSATLKKATESGVIVSSTLRRCVQSAEQLSRNRAFAAEEVFCEAELPLPNRHFPRLPFWLWSVVFRLAWFCGFFANAEPLAQATERARNAAERLIELARENGSVFLVGHGVMNLLIAGQLSALGWSGPKRPANKYWQFSAYHAPS